MLKGNTANTGVTLTHSGLQKSLSSYGEFDMKSSKVTESILRSIAVCELYLALFYFSFLVLKKNYLNIKLFIYTHI